MPKQGDGNRKGRSHMSNREERRRQERLMKKQKAKGAKTFGSLTNEGINRAFMQNVKEGVNIFGPVEVKETVYDHPDGPKKLTKEQIDFIDGKMEQKTRSGAEWHEIMDVLEDSLLFTCLPGKPNETFTSCEQVLLDCKKDSLMAFTSEEKAIDYLSAVQKRNLAQAHSFTVVNVLYEDLLAISDETGKNACINYTFEYAKSFMTYRPDNGSLGSVMAMPAEWLK